MGCRGLIVTAFASQPHGAMGPTIQTQARIYKWYVLVFIWTILFSISSFTVRASQCGGLPSSLSGSVPVSIHTHTGCIMVCCYFDKINVTMRWGELCNAEHSYQANCIKDKPRVDTPIRQRLGPTGKRKKHTCKLVF